MRDLGRLEWFDLGWNRNISTEACMHDTSNEKDGKLGSRRDELFMRRRSAFILVSWFSTVFLSSRYAKACIGTRDCFVGLSVAERRWASTFLAYRMQL